MQVMCWLETQVQKKKEEKQLPELSKAAMAGFTKIHTRQLCSESLTHCKGTSLIITCVMSTT